MPGLIPWHDPGIWQEVSLFFSKSLDSDSLRFQVISPHIDRIKCGYAQIDSRLNELCNLTCGECTDNCCVRATVWYDFRDLLFHQLLFGELPTGQIAKKTEGGCMHLGPRGCTLPRIRRPFICTWYICGAQKRYLSEFNGGLEPESEIEVIKEARKEMEMLFYGIVTLS